jgi:CBS domain-containing protein
MKVKDIMSSPVVTVTPETPVKTVADILVGRDISAVPVVDRSGKLLGIVSEADLLPIQTVSDPRLHLLPLPRPQQEMPWSARQVMSSEVVCLSEDADAADAARLMLERGVKRIPVVSEDRVTGIISRRDLLKVLARPDEEVLADIQRLLTEQADVIGHYRVVISDGHVTLVGSTDVKITRLAEMVARSVPGVVAVEVVGERIPSSSAGSR